MCTDKSPLQLELGCSSPEETFQFAHRLAQALLGPQLILLSGTLGAGKTHFAKGFANGLGITDEIVSPTFTLSIPYSGRQPLLHVDAYRIESLDEYDDLGIDDALENGSLVLVEWPEKIREALPDPDLAISIVVTGDNTRIISIALDAANEVLAKAIHSLPGIAD
ncbi:MAG: tRNA (adenosine(37)-N6)-threonylcarbamoyltransferase complex ATPase subunit type 1 TsaE [Pirellulaceae bacterium]